MTEVRFTQSQRRCSSFLRRWLLVFVCVLANGVAWSQAPVRVVMLSDIHFDPFRNPGVVPQLRAAPVEQWAAILDRAPDLAQDADRAAVNTACHMNATDTSWPLLKTAMVAAHDAEARPIFVTLSGDLLAHEFPCRFRKLAPGASADDLAAFAEKTVQFVIRQVWSAFPHAPIFVAMGNNDSGCADYAETPGDGFSQFTRQQMVAGAVRRTGSDPEISKQLAVSPEGDYSYVLPTPFVRGRLLVLQDLYDSRGYKTCAGVADRAPETTQMEWLRAQLTEARARHEQVWVMGHIPPGLDVYASFSKYVLRPGELCSATPKTFLADTTLADTLVAFADVVRLAVFGHTHMDEIRVLRRASGAADADGIAGQPGGVVPAKIVPAITPYFGNHPAFVVAAVDPRTLLLRDWETVVSPGAEGSSAPWTVGYRYSTAYGLPDFSARSASLLAEAFVADRGGREVRSHTYREHFYAGDVGLYALGLEQVWPAYACAVAEDRPAAFHACLCPAAGPSGAGAEAGQP